MKKQVKKLTLAKETLQELELKEARGGSHVLTDQCYSRFYNDSGR